MASGTRLVFSLGTTSGTKTWSINRAKPGATTANIKALANGLITHATFFQPQPLTVNSVKLVTTTETTIDIS